MPRGLTPDQQAYAREVFAELLEKFAGENQTEIGKRLGVDQSRVSQIRTTGKTSMQVLVGAAQLAGRPMAEIVQKVGLLGRMVELSGDLKRTAEDFRKQSPLIGTFLMKLDRLPGLREWIEENPSTLTVAEVLRGMQVYDEVRPRSRDDGRPFDGWGAFFDDALSGRLTEEAKSGDQVAAEALETSQLPAATRARLRNAPKKK